MGSAGPDSALDAARPSDEAVRTGMGVGVPRVVRITRLVSKPACGPRLVDRCRRIADRERAAHPGAYDVVQARQPLDGDRVEVVSITEWIDLDLMQALMPLGPHTEPAFYEEYGEDVESWRVEVFEVTWAHGSTVGP